ncbi:MAG: MFS transporter [Deltaproteobacteria bacterium]|nr:MFS transporter [Deltaproteobacteria bacterium]
MLVRSKKTVLSKQKTPWSRVLLLVGAGVVTAFQIGKAPPVLPAIRDELGMSLFLAGWVLSTLNIIGLLLGSVAGAMADGFGCRRVLIAGLICQAFGSLVGSCAEGPVLLFATRMLEGLGLVGVAAAAPALIFRLTHPSDVRIALSIWSCYVPAGIAIVMFLSPFITGIFGWRALWQANAAILAAFAFFVVLSSGSLSSRSTGRVIRPQRLWEDLRMITVSTGPFLLAATFSMYSLMWLAVMGFLPTLLVEGYGVKTAHASFLTAIMVAVNVPGNLAGGWLLQRGLRRSRLIISAIVIMGLCCVIIYSPSLPFFYRYLACLAFSGCGGVLPASVMSGVPLHAPDPRLVATTNGLIIQGSNLGQVIGPPALALIVSSTGWEGAPWFLVSVALAGIFLASSLARLEIRHERKCGLQSG